MSHALGTDANDLLIDRSKSIPLPSVNPPSFA